MQLLTLIIGLGLYLGLGFRKPKGPGTLQVQKSLQVEHKTEKYTAPLTHFYMRSASAHVCFKYLI